MLLIKIEFGRAAHVKPPHTKTMDATPMFSINSSFSCNGVSEEKDQLAFANYQRILALLAEASAQPGVEVAFDIKMHVSSAASEHPPLPPSPPPASEEEEDSACNICGDLPQWVEMDKKCEDADRRGYAMGYAFADQKWNPVYKAVCEELELVRKEGANHEAGYIRLIRERDELAAAQKELRQQIEEDKQMVQRHLKEIAKENAEMTAWETERLREENKDLQKKHEALLELVEPSVKLMKSNPDLFGGEARGGAPAPGAASPRPPPIIRLPPIKEEDKQKAMKFLRDLVSPSRPCLLVESPTSALPGIVEAEASCSQTEGMCMALTEEQYKEMFGADRCLLPPSPPASPLLVPEQPPPCGAGGCIDCPLPASLPAPLPASLPAPEPASLAAPVPDTTRVCCVDCGKPKPNYNHPNWPSPITKRCAKHLAKHSGLRSPWHRHDPKTIKTHEDALEYIAKRVNISVENLLGWTRKQYQSTYDPWTLVEGPSKFNMGTAPSTWRC